MRYIDSLLNSITMYRLVVFGLAGLALLAVGFGYLGLVGYSGTALLLSLAIIGVVAYATDAVAAQLTGVTRNSESVYITSLILFFILLPLSTAADVVVLALGAFFAVSSKYFFVYRKRHVFNPAAFAAVVLSLMGTGAVGWWVATPILLPFVAVVGLLVVRKIRRFDTFIPFIASALVLGIGYGFAQGMSMVSTVSTMVLSWPLVFFASFMLTEPLTSPTTKRARIAYGVFVGALSALPLPIVGTRISLALALLLGNIFTLLVTNTTRYTLTFVRRIQIATSSWEFVFTSSEPLIHRAGQYMEWTLGHTRTDMRGNRRYFTIASAPRDTDVRLAVRIAEAPSSFKRALMELVPGDRIVATGVAGDFVLPETPDTKLLWVAGGIGITPFISMIRQMLKEENRRDVVLVYTARADDEFAYTEELNEARAYGVQIIRRVGRLTPDVLVAAVPDISEREVYLSGPDMMVRSMREMVRGLHVPATHIHTDYFPGL